MRSSFSGCCLAAALALACVRADAQPDVEYGSFGGPSLEDNEGGIRGEFAVGIGYTHIEIGDSDSLLNSEDGLRFDGVLGFAPFEKLPQFRLGAALGISMVLDNSERAIISNGGLVIVGSSDIPLMLFEPEVRLSWRQYFGAEEAFYVEPGVGFGGVFGELSIDADDSTTGQSFDEWDSTASGRAFLNVGFRTAGGIAGIQASYMRGGSLDFAENASGDVEQFYIGIFGSLSF